MQKLIPEQENGNKNLEKFDVEHWKTIFQQYMV